MVWEEGLKRQTKFKNISLKLPDKREFFYFLGRRWERVTAKIETHYNNGFRPSGPEVEEAKMVGFDKSRVIDEQWGWRVFVNGGGEEVSQEGVLGVPSDREGNIRGGGVLIDDC